ncbi:hypothetical protein [Paragemmobacter aquarius]|uniref:hypothetical protein n=1 Tax=Paragemmobacter aquarius TaxID=2169400 RepID=UPI001C1F2BA3|nr:hypothetical protein [Gemmobacter aquarius]
MRAMGHSRNRQQPKLHFAKTFIAACFLLFSIHDVSAGEKTCTYENSRFEFAIKAPCDYFDRFDSVIEADNGDGILLRSEAEGLEIRVYGSLVREAPREFSESEKIIAIDPAFEIVVIEKLIEKTEAETRVVLAPVKRNYVTIYAEARSEKKTLAELSNELAFIVGSMRSK